MRHYGALQGTVPISPCISQTFDRVLRTSLISTAAGGLLVLDIFRRILAVFPEEGHRLANTRAFKIRFMHLHGEHVVLD